MRTAPIRTRTLKATPIKISLDPGATLNFGRGTTPLMRAARTNDVDSIRNLLDGGADPNAALPDGTTVLMIAAGQGLGAPRGDGPRIRVPTEAGAVDAVRLLLDHGAKVNATSNQGATALHAAVNRGDSVVKLLVERGADLDGEEPRSGRRRSTWRQVPAGAADAAVVVPVRMAACLRAVRQPLLFCVS